MDIYLHPCAHPINQRLNTSVKAKEANKKGTDHINKHTKTPRKINKKRTDHINKHTKTPKKTNKKRTDHKNTKENKQEKN